MRKNSYTYALCVFLFASSSWAQIPENEIKVPSDNASLSSQFEKFEMNSALSLPQPGSQPFYLKDIALPGQDVSADSEPNTEPSYLDFDGIEKTTLTDKELQKMRHGFGIRTNKKEDPRYKPVLRIQAGSDRLEIK